MFYDLKEKLVNLISSRQFLLYLALLAVTCTLIYRIFSLQIVHGNEYVNNFTLKSEKEVEIASSRGNIYDCNGNLLAYNDLAYMVTITDTIESGNGKNNTLNTIIYNMNNIIKSHGDEVACDFSIYLDENDNYRFAVEDKQLLRFLADVYGHASTSELLYSEKTANPDAVIAYLAGEKKYGIGSYFKSDSGKTSFALGMGYGKEDILDIIRVRYNLSLNTYQKYISTVVSTEISEETVADIMENQNILDGVSIEETTIRRYNNSIYFSPIVGYTGKISQEELDNFQSISVNGYSLNDYVGKAGIELSMEDKLQGQKGSETIYVDNLGKIIETKDYVGPVAGNDIYLTIDGDLQIATYNLLEQKIAGILVNKIRDAKEIEQSGRNPLIPIYDIYFALFDNNVIDIKHMSKEYAGDYEKQIYSSFLTKQNQVLESINNYLLYDETPFKDLSKEQQQYQSFIINMLSSSDYGVLLKDKIDDTDEVYLAWKVQEKISIKEYLNYCISKQWIDITKLNLENQYSDSSEIYEGLVKYTIEKLENNNDFSKRLFKYMLLEDRIVGKQVCMVLWEQDIIQVSAREINRLLQGQISAYGFMMNLISNLEITPAQIGLEPCSGSCVITDPNSGKVLALVSYPGYDNNRLANRADSNYLAKLNLDASKPLWNYATQQRTAPGSTFKMVSSVAGLEEGVINLSTVIDCTGIFDKLMGTVHKCWIYPGHHGNLNVSGAIGNSCNCFFYEVGYRLANDGNGYDDGYGIERIRKYADMFGLSDKSGIEIQESEPHISDQYPVASAIGQGNHNYTTVQLARYVTAVANKGNVYDLSLIEKITNHEGTELYSYEPKIRNKIELDTGVWNAIHKGMRQVIEDKTYFDSFALTASGKTGTAQEQTNKPNHALFVGFAPSENPEIAIATRIANGYTSDYAAQLSKDVFMYYFNLVEEEELITGEASEATGTIGGD